MWFFKGRAWVSSTENKVNYRNLIETCIRTVFSLTKNVLLGSSNEGVELTIGHNVPG